MMLRVSFAPIVRTRASLFIIAICLALSACETDSESASASETINNEAGSETEEIEVLQIGQPSGRNLENTSPDRGLEGVWSGQFRCGQGAIALDIEVIRNRSSELNAVVKFQPTEHSTDNVKGGQWSAKVSFSANSRYATFQPEEWTEQPTSSHQMLTFKGRLDEPEMFLTGDVIGGAGCSKFRMTRVGAHPYTGQQVDTELEPDVTRFDLNQISGTWVGSFSCSGNKLDLSLQIDPSDSGPSVANVRFQDPDAPLKSKESNGHWTAKVESNGTGDIIDFEPIEWIKQPTGQEEMLLFRGSLSSNQNRIILNVENPNSSCTQITLKRPTHRR